MKRAIIKITIIKTQKCIRSRAKETHKICIHNYISGFRPGCEPLNYVKVMSYSSEATSISTLQRQMT